MCVCVCVCVCVCLCVCVCAHACVHDSIAVASCQLFTMILLHHQNYVLCGTLDYYTHSVIAMYDHCLMQKSANSELVERMTDTSKYTDSQKDRIDESGRGKGLEGRDASVRSQQGYVGGYKGE